jgi:Imelysin
VARGFHRIEKAVGVLGTTEGQKEKYARRLMEDVTNLREGVETVELEPEDLLTGSVELLNEVSAGRIKGEEDRYARTDLYDTNANIEGSEVAFEELKAEVAGEAVTWRTTWSRASRGSTRSSNADARRRIRGRYAAPPADGRVLRRPLGGRGDGEAGVSALPRPRPPHRGPRRGAGALAGLDGGHGAHDGGQTGSRDDRERGHAPV